MSDETWNKATFVFEFTPDKWAGLKDFQEDIQLLRRVAVRLGMDVGRRSAALTIEYVGPDEDDVPWLVTDARIDRDEEERGL
jgi:hypothetical protein